MNDQFDESANGRARYVEAASKATIEPGQELELEQERRWAQVVARAWDDEDFRRRLLAQPADVLREAGFDVPHDAEVHIVDREPEAASEGVTCLRLPARPDADDLIEEALGLREDSARAFNHDQ